LGASISVDKEQEEVGATLRTGVMVTIAFSTGKAAK